MHILNDKESIKSIKKEEDLVLAVNFFLFWIFASQTIHMYRLYDKAGKAFRRFFFEIHFFAVIFS